MHIAILDPISLILTTQLGHDLKKIATSDHHLSHDIITYFYE